MTGAEYVWVCDPIDGTIPFAHGLPLSTISLALVRNGESILGVVLDPFSDRLFVGEKGQGTTMNGKMVQVSGAKELRGGLIDCECWQRAPYRIPSLSERLDSKHGAITTTHCSLVYPCMLVAAGEYRGAVYAGKTPWDLAAVKVIVEEAGGKVTDLYGKEQRYDQEIRGGIVSNGLVHEALCAVVQETVTSIPLTTS